MLDPDDGEVQLVAHAADQPRHVLDLAFGQAGGHLVQQQQPRPRRQRHADLQQPLLAGRDGGGRQVGQLGQADQLEDAVGRAQRPGHRLFLAPEHVLARPAAGELQAELDVVAHRHLGKGARRLEGARHAVRGKAVGALAGQVAAIGHQPARGQRLHARDGIEEGGLAGAVGADDAHQLAGMETRAHRVHGGQAAEAHRDLVRVEQRRCVRGGHGAPSRAACRGPCRRSIRSACASTRRGCRATIA